jgi:multidrug efflux pump
VRIFGDKRYAMRSASSINRMAAARVTASDIQTALQRENVDLPAGRLEGATTEMGLRSLARLSSPEEFNDLIIRSEQDRIIRLSDVGRAELSAENLRTGIRYMGIPIVGVAIIPQPNTNAIAIADAFYKRLEEIKRVLPPEYQAEIGYDFTRYVRKSVSEVQETLLIAFALVAFIIFAFLRDWRATIIPVVAIPVCIVSAFFIMYVLGFSINILTLVGLVLAIGLVCDDAIVVLENVYVKIERGLRPLEAALEGSREIFFAVVSTTVALAAVFLPIVFLQGLTGRLFREFGAVVAGSVLVSAFVALTLSPMMCRFLLKERQSHNWLHRRTEPFFVGLNDAYERTLARFLRVRFLAWPLCVALLGYTLWGFGALKRELAPLEDRSNVRINVRAPETANFAYTEHALNTVDQWVRDNVPEVSRTYSITALFGGPVNTGLQNIYLTEAGERTRTQEQIFQQVSRGLSEFSSLRVFPAQPPTIGDRLGGQPVQYVLQAPSQDEMLKVLPAFLDAAQKRPELRFVDADLKVNRQETAVTVDRARAAELGVSALDVARTLQLTFGDQRLGYFVMNGKQYQVIGQLDRPFRNEPEDLKRVQVRSRDGQMVSLDSLVTWGERTVPSALYRFDRYVSATVSAGLSEGHTLGDGLVAMDAVAAEVLPPTFNRTLSGLQPGVRLRAGAAHRVPGAGRSVRELPGSADHPAQRAAGAGGGDPLAAAHRLLPQHLQPDRPGHAGGAGDEKRHLDRGVRQSAPRRGRRSGERGTSGSTRPLPADLDDQRRHHPRRVAHRAVAGGGLCQPAVAGHCRGGRAARVDRALAVPGAGAVFVPVAEATRGARARDGGGAQRRGCRQREVALLEVALLEVVLLALRARLLRAAPRWAPGGSAS